MAVIFPPGYTPYTAPSQGFLLMEDGFYLLLEDNGKIGLDYFATVDLPLTHARIAHSLNWGTTIATLASDTATGYYSAAPDNTLTYERWKPATIPASWQVSFYPAQICDYCCIAAHTMGTNGNSLQVQYLTDSGWVDAVPATAIADDSDLFIFFTPQDRSDWRIYITGGTAPEIGVIKFGDALQVERPLYGGHTPMLLARNTVMKMNESESGEYLGRSKYRTFLETTFSWQNFTAAWVRTNWVPLQLAIEAEPFFIAWRPGAYSEVAFGRAMSVPIPSNSGTRDLMNVELSMRARTHV